MANSIKSLYFTLFLEVTTVVRVLRSLFVVSIAFVCICIHRDMPKEVKSLPLLSLLNT